MIGAKVGRMTSRVAKSRAPKYGRFFGVFRQTFELMTQSVPVSDVRRNLSFNRRDVSKLPNRPRFDWTRPATFEDGLVFNYWTQAK
jgi:hypothetical protein